MTLTSESQSVADRLARLLTNVFAPAHLTAGLLIVIGIASHPSPLRGLVWGLLAALLVGVAPYAWILVSVRRGRLESRHIPARSQRMAPLAVAIALAGSGLAVLFVFGAPRQILALVLAMLLGLVITVAVTTGWKISIHAAVAGGTAATLTSVFGPALVASAAVAVGVGWSRVHLRDHTLGQVVGGGIVGAAIAFAVFTSIL